MNTDVIPTGSGLKSIVSKDWSYELHLSGSDLGIAAGDQDPVTRARFGVYSGALGIVQIREPWN